MRYKKSNSLAHLIKLKIEGFDLKRVINLAHSNHVKLMYIEFIDETTLVCLVKYSNFKKLKKILGNKYIVTILEEKGAKAFFYKFWKNKARLIGLVLCIALVIGQSFFIKEIEIKGNKSMTEAQMLEFLKKEGLYVGGYKYQNFEKIENDLYKKFPKITWVRVRYKGNYVLVDLAEIDENYDKDLVKAVDDDKPCDIVADRAGYISEIKPYKGHALVKEGDYVKKGDVLVSGAVPMNSYAYGTDAEGQKQYYVHADADITVKYPIKITRYFDRYKIKKSKTGNSTSGIKLEFMDKLLDFSSDNEFSFANSSEKNLIDIVFPLPLKISWKENDEVKVEKKKIAKKYLKQEVDRRITEWEKLNLKKNQKILNKSLKFIYKENIIRSDIILEIESDIGKERGIILEK